MAKETSGPVETQLEKHLGNSGVHTSGPKSEFPGAGGKAKAGPDPAPENVEPPNPSSPGNTGTTPGSNAEIG
jgi:hypothetical protein